MAMSDQEKEARRQQREAEQKAKVDAYVKKVLAEAPPLSPEQADHLAALLGPDWGVAQETQEGPHQDGEGPRADKD